MAVQSQVSILYVRVDRAGHESGGRRWCPDLQLREISDARSRLERLSRYTIAARLPPVLAILRPSDGGRVLPAFLLAGCVRSRRPASKTPVQVYARKQQQQPGRSSDQTR